MSAAHRSSTTGRGRGFRAGFTLVEAMVATTVCAIGMGSSILALTNIHRVSVVSRLYSCAVTGVQNRLDRVLNNQFIPQNSVIPEELAPGTTTTPNVPVYIDPRNNREIVTGTMETTVAPTGAAWDGTDLHLHTVGITLEYSFRGRTYRHTVHTLRTSDL